MYTSKWLRARTISKVGPQFFWVYPLGGEKNGRKWRSEDYCGPEWRTKKKKKMRWTTTRRARSVSSAQNRKLSRSKRTIDREREREKKHVYSCALHVYIPWLSFSNVMFGSWLASWLDGRACDGMEFSFFFFTCVVLAVVDVMEPPPPQYNQKTRPICNSGSIY